MKTVQGRAAAVGITFLAVMLLVAGLRVDTSVFVFTFGFIFGVVSSVPLTIIVTTLVLRYREQGQSRTRRRRRGELSPQPPVVIVQQPPGVAHLRQPASWQDQDELPLAPTRREFTMIGDGEEM